MKKTVLIIIIAALAVVSCRQQPESVPDKTSSFIENVKTIKAQEENPTKELSFTGRVISNPDQTVSYSSLVSGVIERTYFSLGDYVSKGQKMLDIRSTELSALESELVALETSLQVAERELKSAEELFADRMSSEKEYLERKGKVRELKAAAEKIKVDMSVYGESRGLGVFSIMAPVSGYVISKTGAAGGTVFSQGDPLFSIADLREVWVIANVYAGNLQFVAEGMDADISSISYPNELFHGRISSVSQVFDPDDRTLKARIVLANEGIKLKPEMSVVVKLRSQSPVPVISMPTETIIFDNDSYYVVIDKENEFTIRKVVISGHHGGKTYISSGIEPGERVVIKNQLLIYTGLKSK